MESNDAQRQKGIKGIKGIAQVKRNLAIILNHRHLTNQFPNRVAHPSGLPSNGIHCCVFPSFSVAQANDNRLSISDNLKHPVGCGLLLQQ